MALMSRFAKLDSAMQRGLDNGIALIFGGKVVPAEIEAVSYTHLTLPTKA